MAGILLTCGYIVLFLVLIKRMRFFAVPGLGRKAIGALFLLKVVAGTLMWGVYTFHYTDRSTADIFKFFDDGNVLFSALPWHPGDYLRMVTGIGDGTPQIDEQYYTVMDNWHRKFDTGYYNDAHTMIRYNAVVRLFSFGVYHVHTVFSAFLGLAGLLALYKAFISSVPRMARILVAAVFLWPSVIFWTSAPIKEALLFVGLGFFLLYLFRWMHGGLSWRGWVILLTALLVQFSLKSYVLACMVPGLAALWWCRRTGGHRTWVKFTTTHLLTFLLLLLAPLFSQSLDVADIIHQKQHDMLGLASITDPGSYIPTAPMDPGWIGLAKGVPHAFFLTFLSPLTTWNTGALGLASALESTLLLVLVPLAVVGARRWREIDLPLLLFCLSFCLLLAMLIGWSTPVVGALMRYRVPLLPFWGLAVLLVVDPAKLDRWPLLRST